MCDRRLSVERLRKRDAVPVNSVAVADFLFRIVVCCPRFEGGAAISGISCVGVWQHAGWHHDSVAIGGTPRLREMASWRSSITKDDVNGLSAALGGSVDIVDDYSSRTPLRQAAFENKLACVRWLLEAGADVNAVNSEKWSALHLSI